MAGDWKDPWVQVNGVWYPSKAPRQQEVFDCGHRYTLVHGPRQCGKSVGIQDKIMRILVQTDNASVAVVSRTAKNGRQGAWKALTGDIYRKWRNKGMTRWTVEPKQEGDTKMPMFRVANQFGGESECQLHSINHDDNVEEFYKDSFFSHIYMIEADRFDIKTFMTLKMCLRHTSIPWEEQQFILDTNPPEEGEDHWLHDIFFKAKGETDIEEWKRLYRTIGFTIDDNPYLTEMQRREIYRTYQSDPVKLKRYWYGLWVKDAGDGAFADVFQPSTHVIGEWEPAKKAEEMALLRPAKGTYVIDVGVDVGDVNTAIVFAVPQAGEENQIQYHVIDELVYLKSKVKLQDITADITAIMDYWEDYCVKVLKLAKKPMWRFWSDPSSMRYRQSVGGTEAQWIELHSAGRIRMEGVYKAPGTVAKRLDMLRRMLYEERIYFSAKCQSTIQMLRSLKKGQSQTQIIKRDDDFKHVFDALTYMLQGGLPEEIFHASGPTTGESAIFSVTL